MLNRLFAAVVRRASRRAFSFADSPTYVGLPAARPRQRYMLYLHVPYCVVLCPFCSFHRVRFEPREAGDYFSCLQREIDTVTAAGYSFRQLYVGGGTPTVLPDRLARLLADIRSRHALTSVSVETNPDDLEKASTRQLREAGVDRLSVGVQSFDDELLRGMQRIDKYGNGETVAARLRQCRGTFDTLNVDMIFNLPRQTEASLRRDLDILVDQLGIDQVSWYPLMVTPATARAMRKPMGSADYSRERDYYRLISERLQSAGYHRSSAWCFSRKSGLSDEYIVDCDEYLGLGSGAFSFVDGRLYSSTFSINHYRKLTAWGRTGITRCRPMSERDRMHYYLLMHLFGGTLDLATAERRFGQRFRHTLAGELFGLRLAGAIRERDGEIALTERGYYFWVVMMREFFAGVSHLRDEMRLHIPDERTRMSAA